MFDLLVGNDGAKKLLCRMLEQGRLPGALIFTGPDGIGRKLFALEIARALNCLRMAPLSACQMCSPCIRIGQIVGEETDADENKQIIWSGFADVGVIRPPARFIQVNQIRQLEREAFSYPFEGKARIFLIEEADRLNDASSNALLKILEEIGLTTHIFLITSRPDSLLPTIRSRCQHVRFSPLTSTEIEEYLRKNKAGLPFKDIQLISRLAGGSLSNALKINLPDYKQRRALMVGILQALTIKPDRGQLLRASEKLTDARFKADFESQLNMLETLIRDAWIIRTAAKITIDNLIVNVDLRAELESISEKINPSHASSWMRSIETLQQNLRVNINRRIALDALLLGARASSLQAFN
ncbi:MAG: ATP-binding protein [Pyrinomonadaceae bacterium]